MLHSSIAKQSGLALHGSVVDFFGYAVGFVGISGRGKSTLAASLAGVGKPILSDDCLILEKYDDSGFVVLPDVRSVRLFEDSAVSVLPPHIAGVVCPDAPAKSSYLIGEQHRALRDSFPLGAIFLLGDGSSSKVQVAPLSGARAFEELAPHFFMPDNENTGVWATHFDGIASLSRLPFLFRLDYPRRYDLLPQVERLISEILIARLSQ